MGNQMMMANDGSFNIFMNVSKKFALAAKKERLKQWSMVPHLENKQAKVKEQKKAAIEEAKIPVLVGQRSKLLWRSNTRLDLNFYETKSGEMVVQAYTKSPSVEYALLFLDRPRIVEFLEKNKKPAKSTNVMEYIVARLQVVEKERRVATVAKSGTIQKRQPKRRKASIEEIVADVRTPSRLPDLVASRPRIRLSKLVNDVDCNILLSEIDVNVPSADLSQVDQDEVKDKLKSLSAHLKHACKSVKHSEHHHVKLQEHMGIMNNTLHAFGALLVDVKRPKGLQKHSLAALKYAQHQPITM